MFRIRVRLSGIITYTGTFVISSASEEDAKEEAKQKAMKEVRLPPSYFTVTTEVLPLVKTRKAA